MGLVSHEVLSTNQENIHMEYLRGNPCQHIENLLIWETQGCEANSHVRYCVRVFKQTLLYTFIRFENVVKTCLTGATTNRQCPNAEEIFNA